MTAVEEYHQGRLAWESFALARLRGVAAGEFE